MHFTDWGLVGFKWMNNIGLYRIQPVPDDKLLLDISSARARP